jgi:hypothetical protein
METDTFNFGVAIKCLKAGLVVRRNAWREDATVRLVTFNGFEPGLVTYITEIDADGIEVVKKFPDEPLTWEDMSATDWVVGQR